MCRRPAAHISAASHTRTCTRLLRCHAHHSVVARDELDTMLAHPGLGRHVPLLFLANKMDLPSALMPVELAQVSAALPHALHAPAAGTVCCALAFITALPLPATPSQALRLEDIRERPWQIVSSNALTGEGLDRGMDWLGEKLLRR